MVFQEVRTYLSGASAWPAELRGVLLACWAAVGRAIAPRVNLARIPAAPRGVQHDEVAPVSARPPNRAFLRQWTDGAVRRHKRILAEALAAIRPVATEEDGPRRPEAQVAEDLLARMDTGCLSEWPDDVGPQHPHPVWECSTEDTPVESISITSLKAAEEHLYRRHTAVFFQEHALLAHVHRGWAKRARAKGA